MTEAADEPAVYVLPMSALEPGDVIVVDFPKANKVSREEYDHWVRFLQKTFPRQKHILLCGGASIRVMKPSRPKTAKPGKETTDAGSERDDGAAVERPESRSPEG